MPRDSMLPTLDHVPLEFALRLAASDFHMLTTFAQSHFGPFVALLLAAAVMAASSAALSDDVALRWWYDQARATRRLFVIAGLLGLASLARGVEESVAWTMAVVVAFGVDMWMEIRLLKTNRR